METTQPHMQGLSENEVLQSRKQHGTNRLEDRKESVFIDVIKGIVLEPMFVLLLAACVIYFIADQYLDGLIMLVAIFIVAGISLYQKFRSENAVNALRKLSAPKSTVIRGESSIKIDSEEIVVGDILLLAEGEIISADGSIISLQDFSVNESLITGESLPVYKVEDDKAEVFRGTAVTSGSATVRVTNVGATTVFGKIGLSLGQIEVIKTPLENQINSFVKSMVRIGIAAFLIVIGINFYSSGDFSGSFLQGLTLAMSILPEEIPVAFTTFQALGAFRLLGYQIIVKRPQYVETLGSATVICVDKTGTLTENKMSIEFLYDAISDSTFHFTGQGEMPQKLVEYAMWSSETDPFDPMEKSIHDLYSRITKEDKRPQYKQVHEYPIDGKPPMMTHIFANSEGQTIIAAKGAPEALLKRSQLSPSQIKKIEDQLYVYAKQGFRILGVGKGLWENEKKWPESQQEFLFEFLGLVAFHDPPKPNIGQTLETFYDAGIAVKMVTGDYADTALTLAKQINLQNDGQVLTGENVLNMSNEELKQKSKQVNIFARMFPAAKVKLVNALKKNSEVVAMIGDGVNDAPALKASHIGIAMGHRGSEVAKNAASLIIIDDDLGHLTEAVALGRKIYDNLKKAIRYIVSIHIPIILIVTLPLIFSWKFTDIFSPVHVIFLELIMGPTCSIIYENEPMEPGKMNLRPRHLSSTFFTARQLWVSIVQGIMITIGCLGMGYYFMQQHDEPMVRTVIFITLLFANIFLTLSNRSFRSSVLKTIRYKNYLVPLITVISLSFIMLFLYVPLTRQLFNLERLDLSTIACCILIAFLSTFWIEGLKIYRSGKMSLR